MEKWIVASAKVESGRGNVWNHERKVETWEVERRMRLTFSSKCVHVLEVWASVSTLLLLLLLRVECSFEFGRERPQEMLKNGMLENRPEKIWIPGAWAVMGHNSKIPDA